MRRRHEVRMVTMAVDRRREEAEGLRTVCVGVSLFPEGRQLDGLRWESGKRPRIGRRKWGDCCRNRKLSQGTVEL